MVNVKSQGSSSSIGPLQATNLAASSITEGVKNSSVVNFKSLIKSKTGKKNPGGTGKKTSIPKCVPKTYKIN